MCLLPHPSLDQGFRLLYNLDFDQGHQVFLSWQREHPQDPVGPTAEAAGMLFSEFHRLGVLEGQFYENDKKFLNRDQKEPDAGVRDRFNAALTRAQNLASARLAANAKDRDALFAMTLSSGLQADYAAMIEKKNMSSLHYTREANDWADQLLAVDPKCYDARVATGLQQVHYRQHGGAGAVVLAAGRGLRRQEAGNRGVADDCGPRPVSGTVCAHIAGHRVCPRQGQCPGPGVAGKSARRVSQEYFVHERDCPARCGALKIDVILSGVVVSRSEPLRSRRTPISCTPCR